MRIKSGNVLGRVPQFPTTPTLGQKAFLSGMFMVALVAEAHAGCTAINGWNNKRLTVYLPHQIIVQADVPLGSAFYASTFHGMSSDQHYASCGGLITVGTKYVNGWSADGAGIAATNVEGVGVRLHWMANGVKPYRVPMDPMVSFIANEGYIMSWGNNEPAWRIELIKTGKINGGALKLGDYAVFGMGGVQLTALSIGGGGLIVPVGCTVTQTNISVPMGKHCKSEFRGIGSAAAWKDFDISLECNQYAKINVRIDAVADSSAPGVMRLDSEPGDMAALGVGIQLYYRLNNQPVQFGQQTFYRQSEYGGNESVQLKARYYQTKEPIVPGRANGTATFTLTYN